MGFLVAARSYFAAFTVKWFVSRVPEVYVHSNCRTLIFRLFKYDWFNSCDAESSANIQPIKCVLNYREKLRQKEEREWKKPFRVQSFPLIASVSLRRTRHKKKGMK